MKGTTAEDPVRVELDALIRAKGDDYASISRLLGRNPAYVQQFIKRGVPRRLDEEDRRLLASYFGVEESRLGGLGAPTAAGRFVQVPRLAVGASAGAGTLPEAEPQVSSLAFRADWLRQVARGGMDKLSVIQVSGDSMSPTLNDGDDILVDQGDNGAALRDGIYVLRVDDSLVVKRIALNAARGGFSIKSDNEAYPGWDDCTLETVKVIGRVVWVARRL